MKTINYEKIAKELKGVNNWCCFDEVEIKGKEKKGKIPVDANICTYGKLYKAKSNDSNTWATYQIAEEKSKTLNIGLMFRIDYPYMFLDFDDCIDENGNINNKIKDIMKQVNSYTEVSNSGKGIHIIVKVHKEFQAKIDHNQGIEIYNNRFCVMTGDVLEEYSANIEDRTEVIEQLYKEYFTNERENNETRQKQSTEINAEATKIINRLKRGVDGNKFKSFWNGEWKKLEQYPSHSEADLGFMILLAKHTNKDIEMMDYIFCKSGMYRRAKYDEPHYNDGRTYGQGLIDNAVTLVTDFL